MGRFQRSRLKGGRVAMVKEELLNKVDLFSGLKKKDLKSLTASCVERSFNRDDTLVAQGERGRGLYIIAAGKVKIIKETASGDELEIAILGPEDFFGEMSVLDNAPRTASVIAVEETKCLVLTSWDFKAKMKLRPEIALHILPVLVKRFRETNNRLLAVSRL